MSIGIHTEGILIFRLLIIGILYFSINTKHLFLRIILERLTGLNETYIYVITYILAF